jgi:hypothetical protein
MLIINMDDPAVERTPDHNCQTRFCQICVNLPRTRCVAWVCVRLGPASPSTTSGCRRAAASMSSVRSGRSKQSGAELEDAQFSCWHRPHDADNVGRRTTSPGRLPSYRRTHKESGLRRPRAAAFDNSESWSDAADSHRREWVHQDHAGVLQRRPSVLTGADTLRGPNGARATGGYFG